ncbi:TRAP transporter small permease [Celeribacter persicus]|uniref:TRAP transporter small permease protein n=1 Tax=Celeribacter persicus TaxID=1651082 RepID=A0A2T5HP26_9RHOB|nr:TRAP transporter small permease [Celeribacter persicus]PTQ73331.1 TRAP-type C4-dicarboxylate transport system permease small subunit [Celeribacter persicus]
MTDPQIPEIPEIQRHLHPTVTDDPAWLKRIDGVSTVLNRIAAVIAATFLVLMTLLILTEITLRLFSLSTYMADVLVGYGVAAITFLAAPWALQEGAMIRVTVLTERMNVRLRWVSEAFVLFSVGFIILFLMAYQWKSVAKLFARGSTSQHFIPIPLWIPESFFLIGLALILLQIIVRILRLFTVGHAEERALSL